VSATKSVLKYLILQDLVISVTIGGSTDGGIPAESIFQDFLNVLRTQPVTKYLAANIGNVNSSSLQRKQGAELFKSRGIRVAVVTEDSLTRGLVTAVGWLGANISAFSWADTKAALKYLDVKGQQEESALAALARLRVTVEASAR
jgi:hypothetical protein